MHWVLRWAVALTFLVLGLGGMAADTQPPGLPPSVAAAAAYKTEIRTAAAHASYAADSSTASSVREHLGHVLACIEGPKGKHVNSAWENPCAGQGKGVFTDLEDDPGGQAWVLVAQAADYLALAGLTTPTLEQGKMAARGVAQLLTLIAQGR